MRLVTYAAEGAARAGVIAGDGTVVAARDLVKEAPDDVLGVIAAGERTWRALADAAAKAKGGTPLVRAKLLAPIPRPKRNVFCVGWNYREHFVEGTSARGANEPKELPQHPAVFSQNPKTVARIIAELSAGLTLEPGDVVITGTPSGVGNARVPKEFMKPGDTVEVEIENIGVLRNRIERRS